MVPLKRYLEISFCILLVIVSVVAESAMTAHALEEYDKKGHYQAEIEIKIKHCLQELKQWRSNHEPVKNPIAIFDIDETILSNINLIRNNGYRFTKNDFETQIGESRPTVIQPTYDLLQYLKEQNIPVYFITGRTQDVCEIAESQLAMAGIQSKYYHSITCTPAQYKSAHDFKKVVRKKLTELGYTVVLNISDQSKDLLGTETGVICKLPNPFYEVD